MSSKEQPITRPSENMKGKNCMVFTILIGLGLEYEDAEFYYRNWKMSEKYRDRKYYSITVPGGLQYVARL